MPFQGTKQLARIRLAYLDGIGVGGVGRFLRVGGSRADDESALRRGPSDGISPSAGVEGDAARRVLGWEGVHRLVRVQIKDGHLISVVWACGPPRLPVQSYQLGHPLRMPGWILLENPP